MYSKNSKLKNGVKDVYTQTTSFDFDYLYYLEIYILAESSEGENFLDVMLIDNSPDPARV